MDSTSRRDPGATPSLAADAAPGSDVCLFAHFDPDGVVDETILYYLGCLHECGFAIVFVSTSAIRDEDAFRLGPYCIDVIVRPNDGLDFASWAQAYRKHEKAITRRLLLANSSVYGPVTDLGAAIAALTSKPADFYGLVESVDIAPHLQSWFLLFEPQVARSEALKAILDKPYATMTKQEIIENGEVRLAGALEAAGYRYGTAYGARSGGWGERLLAPNPMHQLWREMLEGGIPFVKVALLRDNPLGLSDVDDIGPMIAARNPELWRLIATHLARVQSPRSTEETSIVRHIKRIISTTNLTEHALMRRGYAMHRAGRRSAEFLNTLAILGLRAAKHSIRIAFHAVVKPAIAIRRAWRSARGPRA